MSLPISAVYWKMGRFFLLPINLFFFPQTSKSKLCLLFVRELSRYNTFLESVSENFSSFYLVDGTFCISKNIFDNKIKVTHRGGEKGRDIIRPRSLFYFLASYEKLLYWNYFHFSSGSSQSATEIFFGETHGGGGGLHVFVS